MLDLETNCICDSRNFTRLTWLMLLHYLVKVETPKMHANTNSSFNVNYETAVNSPNCIDSFTKCSDEPHSTNKQLHSMCSKCPPPARTHDLRRSCHWSIAASITFCSKSTQVCVKRFCRSQMTQSFVLYTHCCITPRIVQSTGPFGWSVYDTFDAIFFGNIQL